jgi:hypothetical protein
MADQDWDRLTERREGQLRRFPQSRNTNGPPPLEGTSR